MNKSQIKAELRRSAREDKLPYDYVDCFAYLKITGFAHKGEWIHTMKTKDLRIFFLIVAEAL